MKPLDIVGITEVATLAGVPLSTVTTWQSRSQLPRPDAVLSMGVVWRHSTITKWMASEAGKKKLAPTQRRLAPRAA